MDILCVFINRVIVIHNSNIIYINEDKLLPIVLTVRINITEEPSTMIQLYKVFKLKLVTMTKMNQ